MTWAENQPKANRSKCVPFPTKLFRMNRLSQMVLLRMAVPFDAMKTPAAGQMSNECGHRHSGLSQQGFGRECERVKVANRPKEGGVAKCNVRDLA